MNCGTLDFLAYSRPKSLLGILANWNSTAVLHKRMGLFRYRGLGREINPNDSRLCRTRACPGWCCDILYPNSLFNSFPFLVVAITQTYGLSKSLKNEKSNAPDGNLNPGFPEAPFNTPIKVIGGHCLQLTQPNHGATMSQRLRIRKPVKKLAKGQQPNAKSLTE